MRVLVCGDRDWSDYGSVEGVLAGLLGRYRALTIIEGGARGADACAAVFARRNPNVAHERYPAKWPPRGAPKWEVAKAGHDRNQRMLEEGKPDLVVAFKDSADWNGKGGTEDMVRRARASGLPVQIVPGPLKR